jgi:hypothetical protein
VIVNGGTTEGSAAGVAAGAGAGVAAGAGEGVAAGAGAGVAAWVGIAAADLQRPRVPCLHRKLLARGGEGSASEYDGGSSLAHANLRDRAPCRRTLSQPIS